MTSGPRTVPPVAPATASANDGDVLLSTAAAYEQLRAHARAWEAATGRLLDHIELAQGARCLDAGCGPGETMRLTAQRVGPAGQVIGIDINMAVGARALDMLHAAGHLHCTFEPVDVERAEWVAGAPFDLVYARLLLSHVGDPITVLRRLWRWVAPGGHLVVQDYDLRTCSAAPPLATVEELTRIALGAMAAAGRDVDIGHRLPLLFRAAGIGAPDGTDVAGRLEPLDTASAMLAAVYDSVLPIAVAHRLTTPERSERWLEALGADAAGRGDHQVLWPLLIGCWKRKPRHDEHD